MIIRLRGAPPATVVLGENIFTKGKGDRLRFIYLASAGGASVLAFILVGVTGGLLNVTIPVDDYLAFHLVVEFASIVVSFAILAIGWFGYKQRPDVHNLVLAITFLTVGLLDFVHALSFEGMPDFLSVNTVNKAASFWIIARLVTAVGLLLVSLIPEGRPPSWLRPRVLALTSMAAVAALTLLVNYTSLFPTMFVEGDGLTSLKNGLEYLVMAIYATTILVLWQRQVFSKRATIFLQAALLIGIFSELAFTLYDGAFDTYNFLGHIFKTVSFYFILRAIFVSSLQQPYRELSQAQADLERSFESIGQALSSSLELNQTLDLIVRLASDLLRSPYALVALQQREPNTLTVFSTYGVGESPTTIPLKDNLAAKVWRDHEPVWIEEINESSQPYPSVMSGSSFRSALAAPILRDGVILGEIAVYSEEAGAFHQPEARLLAAFARQAAVAIENTRLYESELRANLRINSYVNQLSVLHEIGLSLNRETDSDRLLKKVLESAAKLTVAGVGIMVLISDGSTRVVSEFYAPWFREKCEIDADAATLHQRINRYVTGGDAARLTSTDGLDMLPVGHITLRGLLIGTLRDTHGKILGHFMLSDKDVGGDFSAEDEEVISLLAAQSSVALVSAESFAKEHVVAEALQTALLPEIPDRDDVEVGLLYRSSGKYGRVGGDFYDFIELGEHRIAIAVGDVCGKGLEAATYTAMIKYMLRAYLGEGMSPDRCLTKLNLALQDQLPLEKFITAGLAIVDTDAQVITYSSAGHPPPLICHHGKASLVDTPAAVPLGVLPDQAYSSMEISSTEACSLFMYSDGLIEARPEDGEPFGEQRLVEALTGRCCDQAQKTVGDLLEKAIEYSRGQLRDDIAMVCVRLIKDQREQHN